MRSCPKCKTSDYNNRQFKLMINECGHSLCFNCVENIYVRNVAPCPTCGRTLRKGQFWEQIFDDPMVEKEMYYRKKLAKIFVLKEESFPSLANYNNYLEQVEEFVFNLTNDVDVEETKQRIEQFQKENNEEISRARGRKSADEIWIAEMLQEEESMKNRLNFYSAQTENENKQDNKSRDIIEELMTSDLPAQFVINNRKRALESASVAASETSAKYGRGSFLPSSSALPPRLDGYFDYVVSRSSKPLASPGEPYAYLEPECIHNGPNLPKIDELDSLGYLAHVRSAEASELAAGYHHSFACYRALLDAFDDLLA